MLAKLALSSFAIFGLVLAAPAAVQADHWHRHYHVEYRSPLWQERSFDSHSLAHEFGDEMRARGFQAHVVHHRFHYHVRFRLAAWQTYRTVSSHSLAHELQDILQARGYEVRVVHH